jgi:sugar lactone lactonase YvrE
LGQTNFVLRDRRGRLWFTVTTRQDPWTRAGRERIADGYVGLIDDRGARIVADHFFGTNEVRLDASEQWLYVVETSAGHISRLRVHADGSLSDREVYGPDQLGGRPDGMAFDAYGNLWITLVSHDRLVALTPEGDVLLIWEDGDPEAKARRDQAERDGRLTPQMIDAARGRLAPRMASVTFGGADLSTVYVGSLLGTTLPTFRAPVPGQPMVHWEESWSNRSASDRLQ